MDANSSLVNRWKGGKKRRKKKKKKKKKSLTSSIHFVATTTASSTPSKTMETMRHKNNIEFGYEIDFLRVCDRLMLIYQKKSDSSTKFMNFSVSFLRILRH